MWFFLSRVLHLIKAVVVLVVTGSSEEIWTESSINMTSPEFVECDNRLCPGRAASYFTKELLSLAFCNHHAAELKESLIAEEWSEVEIPPNNEIIIKK